MNQPTFSGFSAKGLDLLIENRLTNDKAFYDAHKKEIEQTVLTPFRALCECMAPTMLEIDPHFVTLPSKMVSRVRRDTRFTREKTLYRANMWLFFRRTKNTQHEVPPAFYMEVSPEFWGYGCYGAYGQGEMATARELIVKEDKRFLSAFQAVQKNKQFYLDGDQYKRPRMPEAPAEYQTWLNRKNLGLHHTEYEDFSPLWDGSFVHTMLSDLRKMAPFYHFLQTVCEQTRNKESENIS